MCSFSSTSSCNTSISTQKKLQAVGLDLIPEESEIVKSKSKLSKNMEILNELTEKNMMKSKGDLSNSSTNYEDDLDDLNDFEVPIFNKDMNYFWK